MNDIIKSELAKIKATYQRLDPELVVEAAKNPLSPLHEHFTWDDGAAAHAYRIAEAKVLIRVVVRMNTPTNYVRKVQATKAASPTTVHSQRVQGYVVEAGNVAPASNHTPDEAMAAFMKDIVQMGTKYQRFPLVMALVHAFVVIISKRMPPTTQPVADTAIQAAFAKAKDAKSKAA